MFECPSTDGGLIATFFVVQGGGAAGWQAERVNIRRQGEVIDFDKFSFEMWHGYDLAMNWESDLELSIYYPQGADISEAQGNIYGTSQSVDSNHIIEVTYLGVKAHEGSFVDHEKGCIE